jgi:VWFA-related protein
MPGTQKLLVMALSASMALLWPQAAQQPQKAGPEEDPRVRIRTRVELVVVPVTVKDSQGNLVHDVRQSEFRVFEDNVEQELQLFSTDTFPLSVVVLIDNSLPQRVSQEVEQSARAIAAGFGEFDEVSLALFEAYYEPVLDFTADNNKFYDTLKRLKLGGYFPGQGSPAMTSPAPRVNAGPPLDPRVPTQIPRTNRRAKNLYDALYAAAEQLRTRARERRKIILLISDGVGPRGETFDYDAALKQLLSSDVSVYAIGVGDARLNLFGNVLAKFARATGGDILYAGSRSELESLYPLVTEQARTQYTLAYVPKGDNRALSYHSIEVRVRRPNLTLLAREGYYVINVP